MASIKVIALSVDDEKSKIVFVSPAGTNQRLNYDSDAFGFGYTENYESTGIERYPFVMEEHDEGVALLDWGSTLDKNIATIDVLGRPINVGGIITYNEIDEDGVHYGPYDYRISSIVFFE